MRGGAPRDPARLRALFDAVAGLPPGEAHALLERECDDAELRTEVLSLLAHAAPSADFLEHPTAPLSTATDRLLAPRELGPYRLLAPLARGGHGSVHRAEHAGTGRIVAVKTVHAPSPALLEGIRREIHTLARMRHPGVVRILDHGLDLGMPWYAMELVEGVTLAAVMGDAAAAPRARGDGPASGADVPDPRGGDLARRLGLAHALCDPLGYVHGEGIVHRDLKPGNVMIRKDGGSPVIVDFGVAARLPSGLSREVVDLEGAIVGTVLYMSPEQIRGELVDARADLYSLGCILYELVTGRPPFTGTEAGQVLGMHLRATPRPPSELVPGLPAGLDDLLLGLLQKEPRRRPGYAADVASSLREIAGLDSPPPGARARSYLYRPRMVGREAVLGDLLAMAGDAQAGRGAVAMIGGESGIGKTRLLVELGRHALQAGMQVMMGECQASLGAGDAGAIPLQPLRRPLQLVADRCRARGDPRPLLGDGAALLALYEPELASLPGVEAGRDVPSMPPAQARRRLFGHLRHTLSAVARDGPVLLVLDDLHWADDLSLAFVEHLADGAAGDIPMLLVGTYRPEETSPRLGALGRRASRSFVVGRLPEEAIADMVVDMLALAAPDPALVAALSREAEGNPFFVAEYLRAAVQERILDRDRDGRFRADGTGLDTVRRLPSSLRDLIASRLAALSAPAMRLARAGAVLGPSSDAELWLQVAAMAPEDGYPALEELLTRQVLEEIDDGRLRFTHDKIRHVAYEALPDGERIALHQRSAERLAERRDGDVRSAEIGLHWERAGIPERARSSYLAAARRSAERYALAEAAEQYGAYLRLSPPAADAVAARVELGHRVLGPLGRRPEAIDVLERALGDARDLGLRGPEAACGRALGHLHHVTGRTADAHRLYGDAVAVARAGADTDNERRALEQWAVLHQEQGDMDRARELYGQALALHRLAGDARNAASALANLATVHHRQRRLDEARRLYGEAIEAFRRLDDRRLEGDVLGNLGALELELGSLDEARELFQEALGIARTSAHRGAELLALGNLGLCRRLAGSLEEARGLHEAALAVARDIGDAAGEGVNRLGLAEISTDQGRLPEALADCDALSADPRVAGVPHLRASTALIRGGILRRQGRLDDAAPELDLAATLFSEMGDRLELAKARCQQGHLALARGGSAAAELGAVRAIAAELAVGDRSELGRMLFRLERSAAGLAGGAPLTWGEIGDPS